MNGETVLGRLKRMQAFKHRKLRYAEYLESNDGDFRFEIAVLGLREVLRKYHMAELEMWAQRLERNTGGVGGVGGASSVFGAGGGGGGGSGQFVYTVPQGVSQVQITAIGGGGGGGGPCVPAPVVKEQNKWLKNWWGL